MKTTEYRISAIYLQLSARKDGDITNIDIRRGWDVVGKIYNNKADIIAIILQVISIEEKTSMNFRCLILLQLIYSSRLLLIYLSLFFTIRLYFCFEEKHNIMKHIKNTRNIFIHYFLGNFWAILLIGMNVRFGARRTKQKASSLLRVFANSV